MPNKYQPSPENVCAVVVTMNPDPSLYDRLQELSNQVSQIVVVDNGSLDLGKHALQDITKLHLIKNPHNRGIATALNQGFDKAIELGYEWVLTLDQDSRPDKGMLSSMQIALAAAENSEKIAIIAPIIVDLGGSREARFLSKRSGFLFRRIPCEHVDLINVITVITSGALINVSAFETIGEFREDLFIDYVDTEFCLRARLRGYQILVACQARLMHQFGARKRLSRGP
ncbi:MAG: glycosyltransferase family 2 protein, partial [Chloroflexi bacterium]|nr:glycosyltransferase family 2 protein [Chloroflexota bacterium]